MILLIACLCNTEIGITVSSLPEDVEEVYGEVADSKHDNHSYQHLGDLPSASQLSLNRVPLTHTTTIQPLATWRNRQIGQKKILILNAFCTISNPKRDK